MLLCTQLHHHLLAPSLGKEISQNRQSSNKEDNEPETLSKLTRVPKVILEMDPSNATSCNLLPEKTDKVALPVHNCEWPATHRAPPAEMRVSDAAKKNSVQKDGDRSPKHAPP